MYYYQSEWNEPNCLFQHTRTTQSVQSNTAMAADTHFRVCSLIQTRHLPHQTSSTSVIRFTELPPTRVQQDEGRANGDESYQRGLHRRDCRISRHCQLCAKPLFGLGHSTVTVPRSQVGNVGHAGRRGDLRPCKGWRSKCREDRSLINLNLPGSNILFFLNRINWDVIDYYHITSQYDTFTGTNRQTLKARAKLLVFNVVRFAFGKLQIMKQIITVLIFRWTKKNLTSQYSQAVGRMCVWRGLMMGGEGEQNKLWMIILKTVIYWLIWGPFKEIRLLNASFVRRFTKITPSIRFDFCVMSQRENACVMVCACVMCLCVL